MKVAVVAPGYLPTLLDMARAAVADIVLLDTTLPYHTSLELNRSLIRNGIGSSIRTAYLHIPVTGQNGKPIKDVAVEAHEWLTKHPEMLEKMYGNTRYWTEMYASFVKPFYSYKWDNLYFLSADALVYLCKQAGLTCDFTTQEHVASELFKMTAKEIGREKDGSPLMWSNHEMFQAGTSKARQRQIALEVLGTTWLVPHEIEGANLQAAAFPNARIGKECALGAFMDYDFKMVGNMLRRFGEGVGLGGPDD